MMNMMRNKAVLDMGQEGDSHQELFPLTLYPLIRPRLVPPLWHLPGDGLTVFFIVLISHECRLIFVAFKDFAFISLASLATIYLTPL